MKTDFISKLSRISRSLLAATLALAASASLKADNFFDNTILGVNLGNASGGTTGGHNHWAIFTMGGNVTITDPSYTGTADVYGNVGISGSGKLSQSNSYIDGFVTEANTVTNTLAGNGLNPYFIGSIGVNSPYLSQGATDATNASIAAAAATPNFTGTLVTTTAKSEVNLGISGGGLAGQTYVLNLTDLILQGASAVLTLHGTATTNYIINIDRYMTLAGGAKINLAGGLTDANVLYNVKQGQTYDVTLGGGSEAHGIILATNRAVKETGGSTVYGEVIAKSVSLSGASKVINPLTSP